jgi:hypothetical protein
MAAEEHPDEHHPRNPGTRESDDYERDYGEDRDDRHRDRKGDRGLCPQWRPAPVGLVVCRQVRDDGVKLAVCACGEDRAEALLELLGQQSPLAGGVSQALGDALAFLVRSPQRRSPCHRGRG